MLNISFVVALAQSFQWCYYSITLGVRNMATTIRSEYAANTALESTGRDSRAWQKAAPKRTAKARTYMHYTTGTQAIAAVLAAVVVALPLGLTSVGAYASVLFK